MDVPNVDHVLARIPDPMFKVLSISEGWYGIVVELDRRIAELHPDYEINQIKEKFGELRFYTSVDDDPEVNALVRAAEQRSAVTCQVCGKPGKKGKTHGWTGVSCPEHE